MRRGGRVPKGLVAHWEEFAFDPKWDDMRSHGNSVNIYLIKIKPWLFYIQLYISIRVYIIKVWAFVFWCGLFLKSLLNLLQFFFWFLFFFFFFFFLPHGIWDLSSWPDIETSTPALGGEVLTTGPPGKSLCTCWVNRVCSERTPAFPKVQ